MKFQTFSILAGTAACNARCPFCVSKMTPRNGVTLKEPEVNWRNFKKACEFAKINGITTAMFTGKGEPTLFPEQISKYLQEVHQFNFPFIELQSNGIPIAENLEKYAPFLKDWYDKGMTTIAISVVHFDAEMNRQIYLPYKKNYIDLAVLVKTLHEFKFSVRLTPVLLDGFLDSAEKIQQLLAFAKEHKIEQVKVTPVTKPENSGDAGTFEWISKNHLKENQFQDIKNYIQSNGTLLMKLFHGAAVYDVEGQNICLSNCLTIEPNSEEVRQLIFFPDGHLRYDWQYSGAILL